VRAAKDDAHQLSQLREHRTLDGRQLGDLPLGSITEDELEAFHASLGRLAASTRNQYVQMLKASFRWAAKKGYITRSPISDDSALKRTKTAQRRRRLSLDEEKALLAAAGGTSAPVPGKAVANTTQIEQQMVGHKEREPDGKGLLH